MSTRSSLKKRKVHNAPWSDCLNQHVLSDRLNLEYDNSAFCKSTSKLFHTHVAAAAKVLSGAFVWLFLIDLIGWLFFSVFFLN